MSKRGYHHGNLRQALVEAALDLITEKGPTGFTMAEAAKRAEVSAAAPYRHFSGRDDLIAEIATQGFELFADVLDFAYNDGKPSPLASFEAVGRAYLAFARKYPGHYMAMFESGVSPGQTPELSRASERANKVLTRAADALSVRIPADRRPPSAMFAAHITAMSHGIVELYTRGKPGGRAPFTPEELLEAGIGIYLRGLGLIERD
ncbi:TetR/AcrR family transcriptional regulator [Pararhodobacter zhoushanensis]|uniref:TetR/AcrR family transcriptional regulator n=1 Tax=Pararhodobacter zhoushanensis TaxID=2479545 RepID=A0ABT3H221_9RHOB|nr:TetR/AcrR family transcriptional regulator [Pararhodobacter zhoushanensis]MCW1933844.1 TetR/AcrR family transcriptional regulator [Pararhodobacter zhoushanensis]